MDTDCLKSRACGAEAFAGESLSPLGKGALAWFLGLGLLLLPAVAQAIPVFARIYDQPCGACHTVYPQLNPAGEDFRSRGLHSMTAAIEPIRLHRHFELPGTLPMAISLGAGEDLIHSNPASGSSSTRTHFNLNFLSLLFGGELGPHLSFLGDYAPIVLRDARTGETDVQTRPGMAFLQGHAAIDDTLLNLRAGLFELPLGNSPRVHRLTTRPYLIYATNAFRLLGRPPPLQHGRTDSVSLASTQIGAELEGRHRSSGWEWSSGAVAGSNNRRDNNDSADFFLRCGWRPNANRAGFFLYYSPDTLADGVRDRVLRMGPDVTLYSRHAILTAQALAGHDSNPGDRGVGLWFYGGFVEIDLRLIPELLALLRVDAVGMPGYDDRSDGGAIHVDRTLWEFTGGAQYLLHENLKLVAEVTYSENHDAVSNTTATGWNATVRLLSAFWPLEPPFFGDQLWPRR
ncbi:MAG TPA: hypothetical protein VEB21_09810 [Terriglobales bacterium]|nr:hypothetical protein [Terriglobales bacterium]